VELPPEQFMVKRRACRNPRRWHPWGRSSY